MAVVAQLFTELKEAIDAMAEADPVALRDEDSVLELWRAHERIGAIAARATAAFDADGGWAPSRSRGAASWLAWKLRLPAWVARRRVHLGRALREMPVAERAWLAGEIPSDAVSLLARAQRVNPEAFARDESMLVGEAQKLRSRQLQQALAYWAQLADPDGSEEEAASQRDKRGVYLSETFGGSWVLDGTLDPLSGTVVNNELRRLEQQLFEADWKEARARLGERATAADLDRTPAQRRADALVEMATRSRAMPAGSRRPQPLFTVLVNYETFVGRILELANGSVVTPGSLLPYLDEALIERVVFDSPSRVIDVGSRRRLFSGATRRAIEVRDRECFHDTCDVPAGECEIDHVEPYAAGGLTAEHNGRPACDFHNRGRNRSP